MRHIDATVPFRHLRKISKDVRRGKYGEEVSILHGKGGRIEWTGWRG
jgi:hypothetical protein